MVGISLFAIFPGFIALVSAQGGAWAQCGGIGWTGATACVSGYTCTILNPYYSQCIPGAATNPPVSTTSPPSSTVGTGSSSTTTIIPAPVPTGKQIRVDQPPAYHLYLQNIEGSPILGPESSSGYFNIENTISLINADGTQVYLNIDTNATTAWKPLTFDGTAKTTTWALSGDTIIYGSQQNFIVCPIDGSTNYELYLSTSNDVPSGCTNWITIHLPCLC